MMLDIRIYEAVSAYLMGETPTAEEQHMLINLAHGILAAAADGFPESQLNREDTDA